MIARNLPETRKPAHAVTWRALLAAGLFYLFGPIQVGGKIWSGVNFPNRRQRMKTTLLFGLLLAVLLPADAQSVGAQDSTQRPLPIEIAVIPSQSNTATPHPSIVFDVRNVSAKCVVALSLNTEWRDSQGEVIQKGGCLHFSPHKGWTIPVSGTR